MISPFPFSKIIPSSTFSVLSFPSPLRSPTFSVLSFPSPTPITMLHTHHRNLFIPTATAADDDEDWGDDHGDRRDRRKVSKGKAILYLLLNYGRPPDFVAGKLKEVLGMTTQKGRKALNNARYSDSKKHLLMETTSASAKKFQKKLMQGDILVDTEVEEIGSA